MEGLQVGRIVHYNPWSNESRYTGICKAAIIVNIFYEDVVNLVVFMDGLNDGDQYRDCPLLWVTSRHYSEELGTQGTWHWPERV